MEITVGVTGAERQKGESEARKDLIRRTSSMENHRIGVRYNRPKWGDGTAIEVLLKLHDNRSPMRMLLHQSSTMILLTTTATTSAKASRIWLMEPYASRGAHCQHSTSSSSSTASWNISIPIECRRRRIRRTSGAAARLWSSSAASRCCTMESSGRSFDFAKNEGAFQSCKVAVIGAGAAGLVAARELLREHHSVTLFEQTESVGGVWVYDPEIENDDVLGLLTHRKRVHSSMYFSLRTNLPRELMGFTDFPFLPRAGRDSRRFPGHAEVASYLQEFAEFYGILNFVEFATVVEYVGLHRNGSKQSWKVRTRRRDCVREDVFDAVVVCNGHYSEPKLAEVPGISKWPGVQMHSHNYRKPSSFIDQTVVVIGNGASGEDISRDIAQVAKEVHISGRTWGSPVDFGEPVDQHSNIYCHSTIECACEDGTVKFKSGGSVSADIILHCTGYFYYYPFLDTQGEVGVDDNCVGPLYEHVFPPSLAPSLAFVGLPWKVVPFQLCELQSRWISMALSGKASLPSRQEMMNSIQDFYAKLAASDKTKRFAHNLATNQYEYDNWLAEQTGSACVETWRVKMYEATWRNKRQNPETYRDVWPDEELHQEAYAVLNKIDQLDKTTGRSPLKSSM